MKEIKADIITIGDEILYGQTVDTNSAFMGKLLGEVGIVINKIVSIKDEKQSIINTLDSCTSDIILITGGLGPTLDDITKQTLCTYFDDKLVLNQSALESVKHFFESRDRQLTKVNKQQAYLPSKSTYLPNKVGTASGMWFEENGKVYISMPGVPREMKDLVIEEVLPRLKKKYELPFLKHLFINTIGIPESDLADRIKEWATQLPKEIALAYLPSLGRVKLRLTVKGDNEKALETILSSQKEKLIPIIEKYVYSTGESSIVDTIANLLKNNNLTISTAESCTGGSIAKTLTSISGSSTYFTGGVVTYSNEMKIQELGVNKETLDKFGPVSEETVFEMVDGANKKFNTDISVASTGIAGPNGGTEKKPVGTVWIAISYKGKIKTKLLHIGDLGRDNNIENATIAVLNLIRITLPMS